MTRHCVHLYRVILVLLAIAPAPVAGTSAAQSPVDDHGAVPVLQGAIPPDWRAYAPIGPIPTSTGPFGSQITAPAYTPAQIRTAYGLTNLTVANSTGTGVTVAIVIGYGDIDTSLHDLIQSDFQTFCTLNNLPYSGPNTAQPTLTEAFPYGHPTVYPVQKWATETAADVEWVHAMAPGAHILLVVAPDSGPSLYDAVSYASARASIVTMSWGGPEFSGEVASDSAYFSTPGVAYFASTGDLGSAGGVEYPAASPNVIAVGGTHLAMDSGNNWLSETGWTGSGGGISAFEPHASFQNPWVNLSRNREVPDVAAVADSQPGLLFVQGGLQGRFSGTSVASPIWAGITAVLDGNLSSPIGAAALLQSLYTDGNLKNINVNFHDILSGSNGAYFAAQGYDLVTGLGSPNVGKIIPSIMPYSILYSFTGGSDGAEPSTDLTQGADGNIYGTTDSYNGAVFAITPGGSLTAIHSFTGADASSPNGLTQGSDGRLYGTAESGGSGYGTVFAMTPAGATTVLHSFNVSDGSQPRGKLIESNGTFYGTTLYGGVFGDGTIFSITPGGRLTQLHSFTDSEGIYLEGSLVRGPDGNFYGTAYLGGAANYGTVYSMTPTGVLTRLHTFSGPPSDGANPNIGLVQGNNSTYYGITYNGGATNQGTIFTITAAGTLTILHSFSGTDGANPVGLLRGSDGNFYGTTEKGGASGAGTIYSLTPGGVLTLLHSFTGYGDGAYPFAGLIQGIDGKFYGTCSLGGANAWPGVIFRLDMGLYVDTSAPTTTASILGVPAGPATITLNATDPDNSPASLTTYYSLDGGAQQTYAGPIAVTAIGSHSIVFHSADPGGNSEPPQTRYFAIGPILDDFNGDGKADLILQNTTTNQVGIWDMNGASLLGGQYISLTPAPGWRVAGEADFNADGNTDLVLQNAGLGKAAIWFLNGASVLGGQYVSLDIPSGWAIACVGDFNGDGKPDLVLQDGATNKAAIWYMNGAAMAGSAYTSIAPPAGYRVAGAGDFNADGKTDLVLQSSTAGTVAIWYMNGAIVSGGAYVTANPASGWSVAGGADFTGDSKPDLILQNAASNQVALWSMNGATVTGGAYLSATPPVVWKVVGPR